MNRYEVAFDGVTASAAFKSRLNQRLNRECRALASGVPAPELRMSAKRKALLILIAAILLLLSACAAVAVYWSSTRQAKEYAVSAQAVDDRQALAERIADEAIAGTTFYSPITGTGEADGVSLELKGVSYWTNDDPPELHVAFDAADAKTGDNSRLTDFEYALSAGGKTYAAYGKADGTVRALPAIARADNEALGAQYEIWFRIEDQAIVPDMPMTLTCTLYSWSVDQRGEALGSFSFDFVYTVPTEEIAARREQWVEQALAGLDEEARQKAEALSGMPNEATQLNIVQGAFTLTDAAASKDGVLLGTIGECNWENKGVNTYHDMYLDGYQTVGTRLSEVYEPYTEEGKNSSGDYPSKLTALTLLPWYADEANLPETVLVAVLGEGGVKKGSAGDGTPFTSARERIQIAFYINPRTGEITLPKDDAEREAWCEKTRQLAADGRNERMRCSLEGSQSVGGVTLTLERLGFNPINRELYIRYTLDGLYCPPEASYTVQHVYMDGTELESWYKGGQYTVAAAKLWVESYGTFATLDNWESNTSGHTIPTVPQYLPDTFEIRLVWDIYDRDAEYNRVFIGSFDLATTVHKADIVPGELWEY